MRSTSASQLLLLAHRGGTIHRSTAEAVGALLYGGK